MLVEWAPYQLVPAPAGRLTLNQSAQSVSPRHHRAYNYPMRDEASYICDSCGEEIIVPLDPSGGERQEYVEDCPVCCCPNIIHVEFDDDGSARVWGEAE